MVKIVKEAKDTFDGIINYFTTNYLNVFKYFSASGTVYSDYAKPSVLLDYSNDCTDSSCNWHSTQNNAFVTFSFKCPIYLTHYRIRTRTNDDVHFPTSWNVQGMLSNDSWVTLDTKTDRSELNGKAKEYTFKCDSPNTAKEIKLTATAITGVMYLVLSRIEFFGSFYLDKCPLPFNGLILGRNTCLNKRASIRMHLCILIFISK